MLLGWEEYPQRALQRAFVALLVGMERRHMGWSEHRTKNLPGGGMLPDFSREDEYRNVRRENVTVP